MLRRLLGAVGNLPCVQHCNERWRRATDRAEAFLERFKESSTVVGGEEKTALGSARGEEDMPFWMVPKEVKDAQRREKLRHAMRRKVPRSWEEDA